MTEYLRVATDADTETLLLLMQEFYATEHLIFREKVLRRCIDEMFENPKLGHVYIIELNTQPVGYVVLTFGYSLEFHGQDALVDEFYVREPFRGQGIGSSVLESIAKMCRDEGIAAVHLEVDRENTAAQQLYQREGFVDHHRYLLTKWV